MAKPGYAARRSAGACGGGRHGHGFRLTLRASRAFASTMLRRLLPTVLACACALSLSSCLDYDEELTIHNDLSGEVSVVLTLPDTLMAKYDQVGKELERSKIEKRLANVSGLHLAHY